MKTYQKSAKYARIFENLQDKKAEKGRKEDEWKKETYLKKRKWKGGLREDWKKRRKELKIRKRREENKARQNKKGRSRWGRVKTEKEYENEGEVEKKIKNNERWIRKQRRRWEGKYNEEAGDEEK